MKIVKTISEVRAAVKAWRAEGLSVWISSHNGLSSRRTQELDRQSGKGK